MNLSTPDEFEFEFHNFYLAKEFSTCKVFQHQPSPTHHHGYIKQVTVQHILHVGIQLIIYHRHHQWLLVINQSVSQSGHNVFRHQLSHYQDSFRKHVNVFNTALRFYREISNYMMYVILQPLLLDKLYFESIL